MMSDRTVSVVQAEAVEASMQDLMQQLEQRQREKQGRTAAPRVATVGPPASTFAPAPPPPRLVVVANRLPINATRNGETGEYTFKMASGGLVSALVSVRDKLKFVWLGWLGKAVPPEEQAGVRDRLLAEHNCLPVFLSQELESSYYNGYCNDVLWPLLHYEQDMSGGSPSDPALFTAYKHANALFCEAVVSAVAPGDLIWVHDYHLMVLPLMLRRKLGPDATIGWFLHTPFPSSEVFRTLPVRSEILRCLLACDLVGFHTFDYARHFLSSVSRIVAGAEVSPTAISLRGRDTQIGVFPIGIEPNDFVSTVRSPACQKRLSELAAQYRGVITIVSVDRLDPIKGLPHRLLGLETLLTRYPEWRGKVTLLQVAVPSRVDVETYQRLTAQVNSLIGRINGRFGSLSYTPVVYLYRSVTPTELAAIYTLGDVALITSLRDGMNLVASEFVACTGEPCENRAAPGALVLSEFAGCAQSLAGAVLVNAWSPDDIAEGLDAALRLTPAERTMRWQLMSRYVTTFTSQHWASSFVKELQQVRATLGSRAGAQQRQGPSGLSMAPLKLGGIAEFVKDAPQLLCVLSLDELLRLDDGALNGEEITLPSAAASAEKPETQPLTLSQGQALRVKRGKSAPPRFLIRALRDICKGFPAIRVVLVSDFFSRTTLDAWFGSIPELCCVADGGLLVRVPYSAAPVDAPDTSTLPSAAPQPAVAALPVPSPAQHGEQQGGIPSVPLTPGQIADVLAQKEAEEALMHENAQTCPPLSSRPPLSAATMFAAPQSTAPTGASWVKKVTPRSPGKKPPPSTPAKTTPGTAGSAAPSAVGSSATMSLLYRWHATMDGAMGGEAPTTPSEVPPLGLMAPPMGWCPEAASGDWKNALQPVFAYYAGRLPEAKVYETDNALSLDASGCDPDLGSWALKELALHLSGSLGASPLLVRSSSARVSVRWGGGSLELAVAVLAQQQLPPEPVGEEKGGRADAAAAATASGSGSQWSPTHLLVFTGAQKEGGGALVSAALELFSAWGGDAPEGSGTAPIQALGAPAMEQKEAPRSSMRNACVLVGMPTRDFVCHGQLCGQDWEKAAFRLRTFAKHASRHGSGSDSGGVAAVRVLSVEGAAAARGVLLEVVSRIRSGPAGQRNREAAEQESTGPIGYSDAHGQPTAVPAGPGQAALALPVAV